MKLVNLAKLSPAAVRLWLAFQLALPDDDFDTVLALSGIREIETYQAARRQLVEYGVASIGPDNLFHVIRHRPNPPKANEK